MNSQPTPEDGNTLADPGDGVVLPGGCDTCEATQQFHMDQQMEGVWHVVVGHDDDCPTWRKILQRNGDL